MPNPNLPPHLTLHPSATGCRRLCIQDLHHCVSVQLPTSCKLCLLFVPSLVRTVCWLLDRSDSTVSWLSPSRGFTSRATASCSVAQSPQGRSDRIFYKLKSTVYLHPAIRVIMSKRRKPIWSTSFDSPPRRLLATLHRSGRSQEGRDGENRQQTINREPPLPPSAHELPLSDLLSKPVESDCK